MGGPRKEWAALGWGPLRQYWQDINRRERAAKAEVRARRKQTDKARPKRRLEAYPWPHRPAGGPMSLALPANRVLEAQSRAAAPPVL